MARRSDDATFPRLLACMAVAGAATACSGPGIVNTDEPWTPIPSPTVTPRLPEHPTNEHLADASEFHVTIDGRTSYLFTTPSGRWRCAILPHDSAACQSAGSVLAITGAPTAVPDADGEQTAPNTIVIGDQGDTTFAVRETAGFTVSPGPVTTLPFGTVLAVAGFRCNVQEATGVSCGSEASGKGFTFSSDGYTQVYTDIPL